MTDPTTRAFDSIKSFHGTSQDNSRDWCDRAEIVFTAFNINDADRLTRIGIKLEDAAFDWYRDNQGPYATWMIFRQAFERAFPPPERTQNRHLLAEQINQRKQGSDETVHDYYYSLDKLCREYDPQMSAIDKTIKLVGGLREDLKEKLLPLNIQTPEQFMIQAKNFESSGKVMAQHRKQNESFELSEPKYMFESNAYSTVAAAQPTYQQSYQPYYQQQRQQPRQHYGNLNHGNQQIMHPLMNQQQLTRTHISSTQQPNGQSHRNYQQTNVNTYQNKNDRKCFRCGQIGHLQRYCPYHLNE